MSNLKFETQETDIAVSWETQLPAEGEIRYHQAADTVDFIVRDEEFSTKHDLILGGLSPGTAYRVTVVARTEDGVEESVPDASVVTKSLPAVKPLLPPRAAPNIFVRIWEVIIRFFR